MIWIAHNLWIHTFLLHPFDVHLKMNLLPFFAFKNKMAFYKLVVATNFWHFEKFTYSIFESIENAEKFNDNWLQLFVGNIFISLPMLIFSENRLNFRSRREIVVANRFFRSVFFFSFVHIHELTMFSLILFDGNRWHCRRSLFRLTRFRSFTCCENEENCSHFAGFSPTLKREFIVTGGVVFSCRFA